VLLPPYYTKDGHMLVDGAILDNVPIRGMHELKSGPNVVISFEVPKLQSFEVDYRSLPGRTALLKAMLNPFLRGALPRAPSPGTVLMRCMMANRQGFERRLRPEDLLLVPPFPQDMGIMDWHRHTELMDGTYRWAMREVAPLGGGASGARRERRPGAARDGSFRRPLKPGAAARAACARQRTERVRRRAVGSRTPVSPFDRMRRPSLRATSTIPASSDGKARRRRCATSG
jgi:predicted acylesterase/phospholipase RssA